MSQLPLFQHQEEAVSFGMYMPRAYLNLHMGLGKTVIALELIKRKKAKALVIAPLTLIETSWRGDWERFGYDKDYKFTSLRDRKLWVGGPLVYSASIDIVNPEAFIRMKLADDYDMLIVDEASKLRNRTSKISKAVYEMSKRVKSVYLLSGNPCPNGPEEWWAQMRCIDPSILGESWYGFLNKYFFSTVGYGVGQRQFKKWTPYPDRIPHMMEKIKRVTFRVTKEEALDLPPQTFVIREIELEPGQRRIYETLKKDWIVKFKGADIIAANALSELGKLRQIASGFVYDSGNALVLGRSKLQGVLDTLDEIGPQQVVLFSAWREEIRQIKEALGEKAGCVYGETKEGNKTEAIKAFQEGRLQYLVCHPKSGGMGLNLQQSSYIVWASLDYSLESWEQANARIHRSGQTKPCTHLVLLAKDTIDAQIYEALQKKADISQALMGMLK